MAQSQLLTLRQNLNSGGEPKHLHPWQQSDQKEKEKTLSILAT